MSTAQFLRTTQEPLNWHACQSFDHTPSTQLCVIITSESTCAQERSRSFLLEPRIRPLTPWQRHSHRIPSVGIAKPCVDSNPRYHREGVWDICVPTALTLQPYFRRWKCDLTFLNQKSPARVFLAVSLLRFNVTRTYCIELILAKYFSESRTWLYPKIWM